MRKWWTTWNWSHRSVANLLLFHDILRNFTFGSLHCCSYCGCHDCGSAVVSKKKKGKKLCTCCGHEIQWSVALTGTNITQHGDLIGATYKYVIQQLGGPYWEKLCPRSWIPKTVLVLNSEGIVFPNTDWPRLVNNIFFFENLNKILAKRIQWIKGCNYGKIFSKLYNLIMVI